MIPEHPSLGHLVETDTKWYRSAKGHLDEKTIAEIESQSDLLWAGWCIKGANPIYGINRAKTMKDFTDKHGDALFIEKNWKNRAKLIQFEDGSRIPALIHAGRYYGDLELPSVVNEDGRCFGFYKNGDRCNNTAKGCHHHRDNEENKQWRIDNCKSFTHALALNPNHVQSHCSCGLVVHHDRDNL